MSFVKVKCPRCGEILTVDDERTTWNCRFCNSAFRVEEGLRLYSGGECEFIIKSGVLTGYRGNSQEVIIPDGVTIIGDNAFENHSEITYIFFPESVNAIGSYAFLGCTGLTRVNIPRIGFSENIMPNNGSILSDIADYLTAFSKRRCCIGKGAFGGCTELTALEINVGAERDKERYINIAKSAFSGCHKLSSITIGASVSKLQPNIFDNCDENVVFDWPFLYRSAECSNVIRRRQVERRCLYCGGHYKSIFTKKRRVCGRPWRSAT